MFTFVKILNKQRLFIGFLVAALLILVIGLVGIWGTMAVSDSFEKVESGVVQEVILLEEIRSTFVLSLLEMTTFLVLDFSTEETTNKQISFVMEYVSHFENTLDIYNRHVMSLGRTESVLDLDQQNVISLINKVIDGKQSGLSIKDITPYKKQLKSLEEDKIFPEIQKNIDVAKERLVVESARTKSVINVVFLLIILSSIISISLVIFLGLRITKKEQLNDQFREQLISVASHQLKSPLTIISGHAELLLENDLSEENKETANAIKTTTDGMKILVRDLLDLSKINQEKFIIEKKLINICEVLTSVVDTLHPVSEKNDVSVQFSKPGEEIFVMTDELKMKQALQNIIGNGIKYNKKGGSIVIVLKKENNNLLLTIKDEGIGIPEDEKSMIFESFYRASNTKEKSSFGTGLGLFISREIIRQSGGEITFKSEENKGTTFFVKLPVAQSTS